MEVREQFSGVGFPLPLCGMRGMQIIRFDGEHLYLQSYLASSISKLFVQMETNISVDNRNQLRNTTFITYEQLL